MYKCLSILAFACASLFLTSDVQAQSNKPLEIAFIVNENDLVPEGIAYDPKEKCFFVSSTYKRKIIKIAADGKATDFITEAQDGVLGVVGMRVDPKRRILWAAHADPGPAMPVKNSDSTKVGHSGINKYDLKTGKLIKSYLLDKPAPGQQHFLNDVAVDSDGRVFATNTTRQAIYTIDPKKDELEIFLQLPEKHYPNGIDITPDNKYLFVTMYASPKGIFGRIDIASKKFEPIELPDPWKAGSDGLYYYKNSLVAIIPDLTSTDKIYQYVLDKSMLKVIDAKTLVDGSPLLSQSTTGVIVKNRLYFVATGNLQLFRKKYAETKGNVDSKDLPPVRIGVVDLND